MHAATEPKTCPDCSARLENDGVCLACLLNEGILAEPESADKKLPVSTRALTLPCEFAGYKLVREVASGGMGIVFEAEDVKLRRVVALKVIRNAQFATREEAARFRAEMQAIGQLDHSSIVPIYESGEEDGMPYYTMRLAEGGSLADRLKKRGILPEKEAAQMMSRIARAVQHAHDHGVLHRDLKPANILLDVAGRPMLSDFGLAKLLDAEFQLTRTQAHVGTPHYMSPEQAAGKAREITTASDTWALGVMLYQMLTGKLPFQGGSAVEVMRRITQEEPEISSTGKLISRSAANKAETKPMAPSMSQIAQIQRDMATLILRCLEKQPSGRLPSAGFLADELDRFLEGKPIQSRPVGSFERLGKLALRHKAATLAILGTSVSLIAGTAISVWQAQEARQAQAEAQRGKAEAETVSEIILDALNGLDSTSNGHQLDPEVARRELLQRIRAFDGDPVRKASLINGIWLHETNAASLEVEEKTLKELEAVAAEDNPELWQLRHNLGSTLAQSKDRREEGIALLRRVLAWKRAHPHAEGLGNLVLVLVSLGEALMANGESGEAVPLLAEAVELAEGKAKGDLYETYVLRARFSHASAVFLSGRREDALKLGRENCQKAVQEVGAAHLRTALTFEKHARNCHAAGLLEEAMSTGQRALECYWSSVGPADGFAVTCLRFMLQCHKEQEDDEGHMALLRNACRVCDQQLGPLHRRTLELVESRVSLLISMGRQRDAGVVAHECLERVRQPDGGMPAAAEKLLRLHCAVLRGIQKLDKAEARLRELVALHDARRSDTLQRQADLSDLADVLIHLQRPAEALPMLQQVIRAFEERGAEGAPKFTRYELNRAKQRLELAQNALAAASKATAQKKDSAAR